MCARLVDCVQPRRAKGTCSNDTAREAIDGARGRLAWTGGAGIGAGADTGGWSLTLRCGHSSAAFSIESPWKGCSRGGEQACFWKWFYVRLCTRAYGERLFRKTNLRRMTRCKQALGHYIYFIPSAHVGAQILHFTKFPVTLYPSILSRTVVNFFPIQ